MPRTRYAALFKEHNVEQQSNKEQHKKSVMEYQWIRKFRFLGHVFIGNRY